MSTLAPDERTEALVVRTREVADPGDLIELLPPSADALAWVHGGDGLIGWGLAASFEPDGENRFDDAGLWWDEIVAAAVVRDEVNLPGTGLVAFGSFTFAAAAGSTIVVPEIIVGRREQTCWVTTIGRALETTAALTHTRPVEPVETEFVDLASTRQTWAETVEGAIGRIGRGELDKVVLAREVAAKFAEPLDIRSPLSRLASAYRSCWTFHVDGFFGSTPEMLVRLDGGLVTSRVLAGTIRRTGDDERDLALAASLARSSKDLEEHEYAVRSVAEALAPHCKAMNVPESPFVLHLPNVMHLATDVTGVLRDDSNALALVASLHPSAAVGGTPTAAAVRLIAEIEDLDRGRYAGPVGWISATGDGEWGIGLRSAQLAADGRSAKMFAGCGIVADSNSADELAESDAKLIPLRDALS